MHPQVEFSNDVVEARSRLGMGNFGKLGTIVEASIVASSSSLIAAARSIRRSRLTRRR
ncbi:hypothetical protein GGQ72_003705 [Rhizobium rhizoryzae]|jgi:hypothetical protein|uniref:Uncharacterized protein n=1 Tax=Rhizobium rhizoryzae TaxID=451876 RepID=A0A7W6LIS2_9HYPH|nr:hypothetical protein [Rhizobium rhizoryzae]